MIWTAPSEKDTATDTLEKRLWSAANQLLISEIDLKGFNSGAAVPTLNRNDIHGLDVLIPPRGLQRRFQAIAGAMLSQSRTLALRIQNLRKTRDLLLPQLLQ